MPTTLRNTDILFNDGTTQSTAAPAVVPTFGAIGSTALLVSSSTTQQVANTTVAGSGLFYISSIGSPGPLASGTNFEIIVQGDRRNASSSFNANINQSSFSATFTNMSGTWRLISTYRFSATFDGYADITFMKYGLYIRVS